MLLTVTEQGTVQSAIITRKVLAYKVACIAKQTANISLDATHAACTNFWKEFDVMRPVFVLIIFLFDYYMYFVCVRIKI